MYLAFFSRIVTLVCVSGAETYLVRTTERIARAGFGHAFAQSWTYLFFYVVSLLSVKH